MIQTATVADLLNDQTHPDNESNEEEIQFKQVDLKLNEKQQVIISTFESDDQSEQDSETPANQTPVI